MEEFLTFSEWEEKHGEKYKTPKYSNKSIRGVDTKRCQKIAAGKNAKIRERNVSSYKEYLDEISKEIDLSKLCGENDLGEDIFKSHILFIAHYIGRDEAERLIEESGRFKKIDGKWVDNNENS